MSTIQGPDVMVVLFGDGIEPQIRADYSSMPGGRACVRIPITESYTNENVVAALRSLAKQLPKLSKQFIVERSKRIEAIQAVADELRQRVPAEMGERERREAIQEFLSETSGVKFDDDIPF